VDILEFNTRAIKATTCALQGYLHSTQGIPTQTLTGSEFKPYLSPMSRQ